MKHSAAIVRLRPELRKVRERAGLSQGQVAQLAGLHPNLVQRSENGGHVSDAVVIKTATALAVHSSVFNGHEPDPTVALELDERLAAAERRLSAIETQLARAGVELAFQRVLTAVPSEAA